MPISITMSKLVMNETKIGEILAPATAGERFRRETRVRDGFWRAVARTAGRVPFMEELVAAYYAALDPKTPTRVRGTLLAALAYFVMPVDLVPDFVAAIGFTDDVAVLMAAITAVQGHIRPRHRQKAQQALSGDRQD